MQAYHCKYVKRQRQKRILKAAIQKWLMVYWFLIRNNGGQKTVEWHTQVLQEKSCQPKTLYPANLSSKNESKINTFQINKNWDSGARRPILQEMLNKVIKVENKRLQTVIEILRKRKDTSKGNYEKQYKCLFIFLCSLKWFKNQLIKE